MPTQAHPHDTIDAPPAAGPGRVVRWPLPPELEASPAVAYRNEYARRLAEKSVTDIIASYIYTTEAGMDELLALATRYLLDGPLAGRGIELGAGCGLLSSAVAKQGGVESILALEVCEEMASRVIPKVAAGILGEHSHKVVPVVGSFDDLQLPDGSLDFAVEIDSLH